MKRRCIGLAVVGLLAGSVAHAHGGDPHEHVEPVASASVASPVSATPQRLPSGGLFIPKRLQRQWGLRTTLAKVTDVAQTLSLTGTVVANPDAGGRIQSARAGTVLPGSRGMPVPGRRVARGEVLLRLRPALEAADLAEQKALLAELDARVRNADRQLARLRAVSDAVPRRELEEAEVDLQALQRRREIARDSLQAEEVLTAPVAGVISVGAVVAGQVVAAGEVLAEIIDPSRLQVEALAYDPARATGISQAFALAGADGPAIALDFLGSGGQLRGQALPLRFRVRDSQVPLAVGQPLQVLMQTARRLHGVRLPRVAVTTGAGGESLVWVHDAAERFEPRRVRFQALDASTVVVLAGLSPGERVVTAGAAWLGQVR